MNGGRAGGRVAAAGSAGVGLARPPTVLHARIQQREDTARRLAGISLIGQHGLALVGKPVVRTEIPKPAKAVVSRPTPVARRRLDTTRLQGRLKVRRLRL